MNKDFDLYIQFKYTVDRVDKCNEIRRKLGPGNFSYDGDNKAWLFKFDDLPFVLKMFPEVFVPTDVLEDYYKFINESKIEKPKTLWEQT
jgi:hypothetical protein